MPIYMHFPGIQGESKEPFHYEWIEFSSLAIGRQGREGSPTDVSASKPSDTSSQALFKEMLSGQAKNVTIAFTRDEDGRERERPSLYQY